MRLRFFIALALLHAVMVVTVAGGSARVMAQTPPPVDIFVEEGIGVDEGSNADPPVVADSDESITVSEDALVIPGAVLGPVDIDVEDAVDVGDNPGVIGPATIEVDDDVTVDDDPAVIGPATIDVDDDVTVNDDPTVIGPAIIDVTDTVLVEDTGGPVSSTPIVDAGPAVSVNEGQAVNLLASVITLNPELTTALIDWADGSSDAVTPSAAGEISLLHLYQGDGDFAVTVTVTGPFGDSGTDSAQVTVLNLPPIVDAGGPYEGSISAAIVLTAEGADLGNDPLTYAWDLDNDGLFDDASGQAVIFSSPASGNYSVKVEATDDDGAPSTGSATIEVKDPPSDDGAAPGDEPEPDERPESTGKSFGRAVIGTLVEFTAVEIVVGTDLGDVRVHVDPASTEIATSLDAEAYTTGSRVVVVADRDLSDDRAKAVKITHIPGPDAKARRKHKRVVVAQPDAGNTIKLVDDDGTVLDTGKSDEIDTGSGDQVVLIVKEDRQGRETGVKIVARADEVDDRLGRIAQAKFDDGNSADSASIDRLREDNREKDEAFIDKVSGHEDADIREAGKDAASKIEEAKETEAADPLVAIRKQAAADAEDGILACAAGVVGRPVTGEADLTEAELDRVEAACLDRNDQEAGRGIPEDQGDREQPPAEVLECIIRVLGEVPAGPISEADRTRLETACRTDDDEADDGSKVDGDAGGRSSGDTRSESDARKIAFCESNPSDPHCEGFDPLFNPDELDFDSSKPWAGGGGGGDEEKGDSGGLDFTGGEPDSLDAELKKLCEANPDDEKCRGADDSSGDGEPSGADAEKRAFCDANPSDPKCAGGGDGDSSGTKGDGGDQTGTKGDAKPDSGGESTGTKDGGGDSSGTNDDGVGDPPPTKSGGK